MKNVEAVRAYINLVTFCFYFENCDDCPFKAMSNDCILWDNTSLYSIMQKVGILSENMKNLTRKLMRK